jgi:hypothetical protein
VLCWQIAHEDLNPIITLLLARQWQAAVAAGTDDEWTPAEVALFQRALAEAEARRAGRADAERVKMDRSTENKR